MRHSRIRVTQFTSGRSVFARYSAHVSRYDAVIIRFLAHLSVIGDPIIYVYIDGVTSLSFVILFRISEIVRRLKLIRGQLYQRQISRSRAVLQQCRLCTRLERRPRRITLEHGNLAGVDAIFINSFRVIRAIYEIASFSRKSAWRDRASFLSQ